ncbi:hypothetical protein D3C86_1681230 [compost metagenome]
MHDGAGLLAPEVRRDGTGHVEAALQVHLHHRVEVLFGHLVEDAIAQVARVVDQPVDAPVHINRMLNDAMGGVPLRHAVGVGAGLAAGRANLVHGLLGRPGAATSAIHAHAQVVHDHTCDLTRCLKRDLLAYAGACASHHNHFAQQSLCHVSLQMY